MNKSKDLLLSKDKINVFIGSDHAGFEMKQQILSNSDLNKIINFVDVGTYSLDSVDYPDYAQKIATNLLKTQDSYGIGICGSGIGICIALNKIKGIYAANITKIEEAKLSKLHNNVNTICLSGRFSTYENNVEYIKAFFNEKFSDEQRHKNRIDKIKNLEKLNYE